MIATLAHFPLYITDDRDSQKAFYTTVFDLEAVFYDPAFYLHLVNTKTGNQLAFMLPDLPSQPAFLHSKAAHDGVIITFEVKSAETALAQAEALGIELIFGLKTEPWGQIHFMFKDPAGFIVDVVEHLDS